MKTGTSRGKRKVHKRTKAATSSKRRGRIPEPIREDLQQKATSTIAKLDAKTFAPKGGGIRTGRDPSRLWTLIPQPSLRRRHMLIDTTALIIMQRQIDSQKARLYGDSSVADRREIWDDVFHLQRVKGVQYPDLRDR